VEYGRQGPFPKMLSCWGEEFLDRCNTSHYREMPFFDGIAGFRLVPKDDVRGWA